MYWESETNTRSIPLPNLAPEFGAIYDKEIRTQEHPEFPGWSPIPLNLVEVSLQ